ncbi:MAG TPA: DNA polymerase III subunit delta' [Anaerolineales bacterium]|nr:DNA polymerase III subunit delta' [Anaerolineales bacterium]
MDWKILGHDWAVETLSEHVRRKAVRHAYLLTGPQGVGRRTLAIRFAQAINCNASKIPGQPCGECRSCRLIEQQQHPDLMVIEAEEVGARLKIDQIREIQHTLSLSPYESNYRVAIFLRFDEANHQAMNALLKTLEEPPARVIILLTAANEELLLPTISSRCEILRLRPLPVEQLGEGLQALWGMSREKAEELAHISGGRPGYAFELYENPELVKRRTAALDVLFRLLPAARVERFAYVEKHYNDNEGIRFLTQIWLSVWRDVLIVAAGAKTPIQNIDRVQKIEELAHQCGFGRARTMVNSIDRTMSLLDKNVNKRLALEVMMLDLPITKS